MIYISVPSARLGYIALYSAHYNPDLHLLSFFSVDPCDLHVSFVLCPASLLHPSSSPSYGVSNSFVPSFVLYISISCSSYSFIFVFISSFLRSLILFLSPIFPALIPLVSSHYSILPLSSSPLSP